MSRSETPIIEARYDYAGPYRSATRADEVLDHMFAADEVCEGERPQIESRKIRRDGKSVTRWFITLPM